MANTITIPVDPEVARAYESATPENRGKMEMLVNLQLRDLTDLAQNLAAIDQSLEDIKAGRVYDARQAMREIAAEHGINLKR